MDNTEFVDFMWVELDNSNQNYISVDRVKEWLSSNMGFELQDKHEGYLFECFFFNCKDKSF